MESTTNKFTCTTLKYTGIESSDIPVANEPPYTVDSFIKCHNLQSARYLIFLSFIIDKKPLKFASYQFFLYFTEWLGILAVNFSWFMKMLKFCVWWKVRLDENDLLDWLPSFLNKGRGAATFELAWNPI